MVSYTLKRRSSKIFDTLEINHKSRGLNEVTISLIAESDHKMVVIQFYAAHFLKMCMDSKVLLASCFSSVENKSDIFRCLSGCVHVMEVNKGRSYLVMKIKEVNRK